MQMLIFHGDQQQFRALRIEPNLAFADPASQGEILDFALCWGVKVVVDFLELDGAVVGGLLLHEAFDLVGGVEVGFWEGSGIDEAVLWGASVGVGFYAEVGV